MDEHNNNKQWNVLALVSGFVFETLVIIGLGYLVGYYLDLWLNTGFVFTVVLMIVAVFYSIYHLITVVNKQGDEDERQ
ncbi:AtpZ/AtpI family protein [Candidatus Xianfuyuplasma coldseepsis]|uniref:AtpZ/AtpI family protein n=1 Tax=Candidatus Xianfuyuplasma coldseepsis TaxID=2782163 RepID=A0A7L7KRG7_9MOLU|nr:AtpZ/AtpI family protein [Xianfuyuplasma coldseepsis]QMS85420.1 AtpZ/AtpI family protein [Xianfuyuplasma coldseepsis]